MKQLLAMLAFLIIGAIVFLGLIGKDSYRRITQTIVKDKIKAECLQDKMVDYLGGTLGIGYGFVKMMLGYEVKKADIKYMPIKVWYQECGIESNDINHNSTALDVIFKKATP